MVNGAGSGGHASGDGYFGVENVVGSDHGDVIRGNAGNNKLDGGGIDWMVAAVLTRSF